MLSYTQAIIFGLLQGITELFPVSSLGHSVVLPRLLGWNIDQKAPFFLIFLVATHAATAAVLFVFFFKDWKKILGGIIRSLKNREIRETDADAKLGWLLVVATIPAGALGILFEEELKDLFANPQLVAIVLILNGILLYGAEILRKKHDVMLNSFQHPNEIPKQVRDDAKNPDQRISKLTWIQAIKIGITQCLALIPGFSRTGSTLTGGLLIGLSHEDAARFSFLLATPIIGAAAVLKLPELINKLNSYFVLPIVIGSLAAGIGAYFSVKFLVKYFETKKLTPFALYCVLMGIVLSIIFLFR